MAPAKKKVVKKKLSKFQAYEKRQKDRGLAKVTVWIPEGEVINLKRYAGRKKQAHLKTLDNND